MTVALDGGQRTELSNLIQKARSLLEDDLAATLEGDFGIHRSDGRLEDANALALNALQSAVRIDLLDIVAYLRSEGETAPAAVDRLIREAAFTHVNRLVALRVAEGLGILPEAIGSGLASQGFRDFAEIAPASADEDWERFRLFVRICADELSADVPALFDPRNPLLELEPSAAAFSALIESFVAADETIWAAPDALGWSYQFFNSGEERKEMRESSAPRNSRELAVRNQFFTPSYVVEFLVQNGLGAHLAASFPALADEFSLLVEVPEPADEPVDLHGVSALDPACGSGHFLLGAYDVIEAAWRHAGVEPGDAAPDVVRSLWGIDIDPRATQIAQAAVIFRARRHCRDPLPRPNVICARSLPAGPETDALVANLPPHVGRVVRAIADELAMAPVLGPLLKIEERLDRETRDAFGTGQIEGTLSEGVSDTDAADVESLVLQALSAIADQTTSTASQRLFAAEAHDAVRFVEAMSRRYTACLMNPPFGEPVAETKPYLKKAFPLGWTEMYAAFLERALALTEQSVSLVSSSEYFRTKRLRGLRKEILQGSLRPARIVRLGTGVLHGASVDVTLTLLAVSKRGGRVCYSRPESDERDRPPCWRWSERDLNRFVRLPGSPYPFDASEEVLDLFNSADSLDPSVASVCKGGATFDNFRFLRLWWELDLERQKVYPLEGWNPCVRGGSHTAYLHASNLRIDMHCGGERMVEAAGSKYRPQILQSISAWGHPGLTVPRQGTSAKFALMPPGQVLTSESVSIFPNSNSAMLSLALVLNSKAIPSVLAAFAKVRKNEAGYIKAIPLRAESLNVASTSVERVGRRCLDVAYLNESRRETSVWFVSPLADLAERGAPDSSDRVACAEFIAGALGLRRDAVGADDVDIPEPRPASEFELLSYVVGCALGRWDVSQVRSRLQSFSLEAFIGRGEPSAPPGLNARSNTSDARVTPHELGDELAPAGLVARVLESGAEVFGTDEFVSTQFADLVGPNGLSNYLARKFFDAHSTMYSASQRAAPIYWQLQVPSRKWSVWISMQRLSREMLFAIVRETEQRQRLAEQRIATLQREYGDGGAGRTIATVSKELDAEQKLAVELVAFRDEAERIANLGWEPDLDDGAVLNAAPLASLFPAWKDAAKYRKELKHGKHTWSTVSKYAEQL